MQTLRSLSRLASLALLPGLLLAGCSSSSSSDVTLNSIAVAPTSVSLLTGQTRKVAVTGIYSDGSFLPLTTGVTFSSTATSVATVSADGLIVAVGSGAATVIAAASGLTATTAVTVTSPAATLSSIAITPSPVSLVVGGPVQPLTVTATYSDGSTPPVTTGVTFSSLNQAVATVSADGKVTAVAAGSTTVSATYQGKTATVPVTVAAPSVQSIAVTPPSFSLIVGGPTQALTVTAKYDVGPDATVTTATGTTYAISPAGVATVSATGVVTAVAAGSATITATYSGKAATATVTVTAPTLDRIDVAPATFSLYVGGPTQALTVTATYSDSSTPIVTTDPGTTYAIQPSGVATVSATGVVTAVGSGSATITASFGGKTDTAAVTVTVPVLTSISATPATVTLAVGGTQALTVTGTYDVGPTRTLTSGVTFGSSSDLVATVDAAGVVTAVGGGDAIITADAGGGLTDTVAVTVTAISATEAKVFYGDYAPGVSFAGFGGAANDLTRDTTELRDGRATLKVVIGGASYSGGAFVTSVPRDLRAFNALTFWAKASVSNPFVVSGIGNNAVSDPPPFSAEVLFNQITGTWTKYVIPLPDRAKLVGSDGLFHFTSDPLNYTVWLSDIQYEFLPPAEVGAPTGVTVNWPAPSIAVGATTRIAYQPNTVSFATPVLPTGGSLKNVSFRWYTLTSSDPTVATVDETGLVTGLKGGTTNITATMNGLAVAGNAAITVTAPPPPLAVPTTIAQDPTLPAANVISLFSSTYTDVPVDTWRTSWSACCNTLVDPYVIPGQGNVKQYDLRHFVGIQFFPDGTNTNLVDASAMTHFHVDVWTPNPPGRLQIQLVDFPSGTSAGGVVGAYNATGLATGSWVGLDIPLSSFAGLASQAALGQILFLAQNADGSNGAAVVYVDNIYLHN